MKALRVFGTVALLLTAAGISASAKTRKGEKLLKQAQKAEAQRDWDAALTLYDDALATDPQDATYQLYDQRIHFKAAEAHIAEGRQYQREQRLDTALLQFQKAYLANPGSQIALQEIRNTTQMLKEKARAPAGTPIYTPAERARQEIEKRINSLQGPPQLQPINAQISSLKINNQPARVLYESVCKLAGINLLVDPSGLEPAGGASKNFNLDLNNNVTIEEALNYVALITHTFWKPISRNAIFVTQEGEQKRAEYQDEVVKVFYVQNASTPNEFTEIFNGVRVGAKLTSNLFQVASQNAIIARGSPDTIALVEKLVHDLDKPKAEVTLDIIVMEVNKNKNSTIGAALLGQGGLTVPFNFTPRNTTPVSGGTSSSGTGGTTGTGTTGTGTTATTNQFTIAQAGHLSSADFSTTLPSTVVNAILSDASSKILQRPQLRVTDGGKASLKIGQKIPYVSGSLNSAVATPGSIPYATTQFQQIEIGTLIDLEPHVNGQDDISMHIRVEISNEQSQVQIAGISEPIIGQQIDEAQIRMRDGEVSLLGGLSDRENQLNFSGVPGFTNVPLLSYIFGSKNRIEQDNEVLIAIIPHIVRAPDLGDLANTGVFAGTERVPKVDRAAPSATQGNLPAPGGPAAGIPTPAAPNAPVNGAQRPSFPGLTPLSPAAPVTVPATTTAPFPPAPAPAQQTNPPQGASNHP